MQKAKYTPRFVLFGVVWTLASAYAWISLDRGWVPHDEGTLAYSAERVMTGMLPHVDYDEVYTGGLAFAGAVAFRVFGADLFVLRLLLFGVFVAWVPVVYWSARRFVSPSLSAVATLLAGSLTIPNYSAAVPSWFNLFFASFSVACLLRYLEAPRSRWLFFAGLFAGISILVKIVGLYLVAGCLLSLAFLEQTTAREGVDREEGGGRLFSLAITLAAVTLVAMVWLVVRQMAQPAVIVHFLLPAVALSGWLAVTEWRNPPSGAFSRLRNASGLVLPFLAGVIIPILTFLVPFALRGGLGDLYHGLFVLPLRRLDFAWHPPPDPLTLVNVVPLVWVLWVSRPLPERRRWRVAGFVSLLYLLLLILGDNPFVYPHVWLSMRSLIPFVLLCGIGAVAAQVSRRRGVAITASSKPGTPPEFQELQLLTLLSVTVFVSLVQFPYATPIYFLYVAPFVVLAVIAVTALAEPRVTLGANSENVTRPVGMRSHPVLGAVLTFYLGFAVFWLNPGFIYYLGRAFVPDQQTVALELERASIRVSSHDKWVYETLVKEIKQRAGSDVILATPDAPEVFFLTGLSGPKRSTFEFFDVGSGERELLSAIDSAGVSVIALNQEPSFSPVVGGELLLELEKRFPNERSIGKFLVRWRP